MGRERGNEMGGNEKRGCERSEWGMKERNEIVGQQWRDITGEG